MLFKDAPKDLQEIISKAFEEGVSDGLEIKRKYGEDYSQYPKNTEAYGRQFRNDFQVEAWGRGLVRGVTGQGSKNPSI